MVWLALRRAELDCYAGHRPLIRRMASAEDPACQEHKQLTVAVEPVEGELSILADLDEIAVGITHVAAPFPAVRIG